MGTVHAKVPDKDMGSNHEHLEEQVEERDTGINIKDLPAKVQRVIFDGIDKTKNDILEKSVKPIFSSKTFAEMLTNSQYAKARLEKLGIFKTIDITIDTSKATVPSPEGYDVKFNVVEKIRGGSIFSETNGNDIRLVGQLKLFNVFGRGEQILSRYGRNLQQNEGYSFQFHKPLNGDPDVRLGVYAYKEYEEFPWSGFKELSRGTAIDLVFPSRFGSHRLKWEGVWRDMRTLNKNTSFSVREQSGHSLKSSIQHVFTRDSRDDRILPTEGSLFKLTQEYAGIGGNVEFVKNDVELQHNMPLILDSVLQISLAGGLLAKIDKSKEIRINDRFFLGGPLTLRGFNLNGVGPHADGNALGADTYWVSGLHLYSPLPFRPGKGGFGELFRSHFFVTAGNLGNIDMNQSVKENIKNLSETMRLSYGLGVVLRLGGIARLELNYVIPVRYQSTDGVDRGIQFGVGLSFL